MTDRNQLSVVQEVRDIGAVPCCSSSVKIKDFCKKIAVYRSRSFLCFLFYVFHRGRQEHRIDLTGINFIHSRIHFPESLKNRFAAFFSVEFPDDSFPFCF